MTGSGDKSLLFLLIYLFQPPIMMIDLDILSPLFFIKSKIILVRWRVNYERNISYSVNESESINIASERSRLMHRLAREEAAA